MNQCTNPQQDRSFICIDCGVCTLCISEYYMLTDQVWNSVADNGMLCIGCLEARLGRELTASDFTACPLNDDHNFSFHSQRLVARRSH